jgi:alkaline phosphatase
MDGFLGDEGALLVWAKTSAWTDGVARNIFMFLVDGSNYIRIVKAVANNTITFDYLAGATSESQSTGSLSNVDFACYAITWSKSGDSVDYYIDGAASGSADTGLGTWAGDLDANRVNIGASSQVPAGIWSGTLGPVALWNKALTADQIRKLSTV